MNTKHKYIFSCIPVFLGLVISIASVGFILKQTFDYNRSIQRIMAPGTHVINFIKGGNYTVFHEYQSFRDGKIYSSPASAVNGMSLSIENKANGSKVKVRRTHGSTTYSFGDFEGEAILSFFINNPGEYLVGANFDGQIQNNEDNKFVISFAREFTQELFKLIAAIFIIIMISFGSVAISTVLIIITYQKSKKPLVA